MDPPATLMRSIAGRNEIRGAGGEMGKAKIKQTTITSLVVIGIIIIAVVSALIFLKGTHSVEGTVTDLISEKPIADVVIKADGKEAKTDGLGKYKLEGLKRKTTLSVEEPSAFEAQEEINISFTSVFKSQVITKDITLSPTLMEIEARTWDALKYGQYDYLWDLMHPDDQAYWGEKDAYVKRLFTRDSKGGDAYVITEYTISDNTRLLPTWKSEITDREYQSVWEVPFDTRYVDGSVYNDTSHWIKVDGKWRFFTTVKKPKNQ